MRVRAVRLSRHTARAVDCADCSDGLRVVTQCCLHTLSLFLDSLVARTISAGIVRAIAEKVGDRTINALYVAALHVHASRHFIQTGNLPVSLVYPLNRLQVNTWIPGTFDEGAFGEDGGSGSGSGEPA